MPPRRSLVCVPFQRGKCQHGSNCRLSHTQASNQKHLGTMVSFSPTRECAFYREGRCSKGDACTFRHASGIQATSRQKDNASAFAPCAFFLKGKCAKGQECTFPHPKGTNPQCYFFLHGGCRFGSQCSSSHEGIPSRAVAPFAPVPAQVYRPIMIRLPDESKSNDDGSPRETQKSDPAPTVTATRPMSSLDTAVTHERTLFHCKASFARGAKVTEITTSFESRTVIISNVPDEATQETLINVFEPFGDLENIALLRDKDTASARVTYSNARQASAAVRALGSSAYKPKMDLKVVESGAAVLRSTKVKISWFAPRRIGWAHYQTISKAKQEAKRLKGSNFKGYVLEAAFQTPSIHQTSSFSVEIKGLPTNTSIPELKTFCDAQSVQMKPVAYGRRSSLLDVEAQLREIGPLDSFDALPEDKNRHKILAFAQFAQPEHAAKAVSALHQKPQSLLNRSPMWLEHIHAVKYSISQPLFKAVKPDLEGLKATGEGCKLRIYEPEVHEAADVQEVCIRIFGADAKSLGHTKQNLEKVLDGHRVMDGANRVVWHDFFTTEEGAQYCQTLEESHLLHVKCDSRNRWIRMYGSAPDIDTAHLAIMEKVEQLKGNDNIIGLDRRMLTELMRGGWEKLTSQFGEGAFSVNIVQRTMEVKTGDIDAVRLALSNLRSITISAPNELACPVCYCEITNPIQLQCGHVYCRDCLVHMLSTTSPASPEAICVYEEQGAPCNAGVDLAVIRTMLSPEQEHELYRTAFLAHIHSRPDEFKYCPTPDCSVVYRPSSAGTAFTCPSCLNRICPACHVQFHEGLTCDGHRDNLEGGNQKFQEWKKANGVKECPKCGASIQKSQGCNHMTCIRCQTHMCWVCLKTFEAGGLDASGGVYEHMRKVHGGMN